jgi:hypothetical protein
VRNRHLHAIEQASRRRRLELLIYAQATRDARVARRGFHDGHPRLELAPFFSVLDDGHREAVLDRRERVEILALGVDLDAGRRELVADLHDGRVAHERRGVLEQTARAGAARRRRVQRAAAAHEASRRAEGGRERGNHGAEEFHSVSLRGAEAYCWDLGNSLYAAARSVGRLDGWTSQRRSWLARA